MTTSKINITETLTVFAKLGVSAQELRGRFGFSKKNTLPRQREQLALICEKTNINPVFHV